MENLDGCGSGNVRQAPISLMNSFMSSPLPLFAGACSVCNVCHSGLCLSDLSDQCASAPLSLW